MPRHAEKHGKRNILKVFLVFRRRRNKNPEDPACPVAPADLSAFGGWYWGKSCLPR